MYRLILRYIFLISLRFSFYTHILVENSSQSYILKIVLILNDFLFMREGVFLALIFMLDFEFVGENKVI
jgi:hypothetical protein